MPGIAVVATITDDFDIKVLQEKDDLVLVPERLLIQGHRERALLAARAEVGMRDREGQDPPHASERGDSQGDIHPSRGRLLACLRCGTAARHDRDDDAPADQVLTSGAGSTSGTCSNTAPMRSSTPRSASFAQRYDEEPELGQGSTESDGE